MSLFGKVLAVLNLVALGGFLFMAASDLQMRQAWSYAVLRWDLALDGIPVDKEEADPRGRPRYLILDDALSNELVGDPAIRTQEEYLDRRKEEIDARIDDEKVKPAKIEKIAEVLSILADTPSQREAYSLAIRSDKSPANAQKLRTQLDARFDSLKEIKDREAKRLAIGRTLVALLDQLPTDDEKKKRAEDQKKPVDQRADPAADPVYRRTLNAIGVRTMSRVLDVQAEEFLGMALGVAEVRKEERTSFVYHHQSTIGELMHREHQLQEQKDKLDVVLAQAKVQEERALTQKALVDRLAIDWEKKQDDTNVELKKLTAEQERLYFVRLRLRDANQYNQKMERAIRKLESEVESENP